MMLVLLSWAEDRCKDRAGVRKREDSTMKDLFVTTGDSIGRVSRCDAAWKVTMALEGSGAQCLALDPREPLALYAGSRGQGVFKSIDAGAGWQKLEFPQPDVFSLAVSPVDGAIYA